MILNAWCDGAITGSYWGTKGNKHTLPHCYSGWVVKRTDGIVLHHHSVDLGEREGYSANVAEYCAVRSVLHWLYKNHPMAMVRVHTDSQVIVRQLTGEYHCYTPQLIVLRDAVRVLAATFPSCTYTWVPRAQNKYADAMSRCLQSKNGGLIPPVPLIGID